MRKFIKPVDVLVILIVLLCSLFTTRLFVSDDAKYAVIYVNGKEYGKYTLENSQTQSVEVVTEYGRNVVVIENKNVRIEESDCKDKVEINAGSISHAGQSLVCLPNRFVVTIEGRILTDATAF